MDVTKGDAGGIADRQKGSRRRQNGDQRGFGVTQRQAIRMIIKNVELQMIVNVHSKNARAVVLYDFCKKNKSN